MQRIVWAALVLGLLAGAPWISAAEERITAAMVEAGGGLQEYGWELEKRLAARIGSEIAGMKIEKNGYHMFPPTLSYRLVFDTDAFIEDIIARVDEETGGRYTTPQLVMAYVFVFERENELRKYLGQLAGAELCESQPERSAIDVGYKFSLSFHHQEPDTITFVMDGREETEVRDRIGNYKHTQTSCEELGLGIRDPEETLTNLISALIETIENGKARRAYEIVDNPQHEAWRDRTLALIKRLKS